MAIYLVDYENVHDDGLSGVAALGKEDGVVIFWGNSTKNIPFDRHIEIYNCEASFEYIKVEKVGKNYLDFQLATKLGYLFGKGEKGPAFIVSKDVGYESVVDFWKSHGREVVRIEKIEEATRKKTEKTKQTETKTDDKNAKTLIGDSNLALSESWRKKIRTALKKENVQGPGYSHIYKAMLSAKKQTEYKKMITEYFVKEDNGISIYNHTQAIFGEYRKSVGK